MVRTTGVVAVLLFAALTAVVGLQVINRLVLHLPLIWSEEAARFLFFWLVLLGAAMSVHAGRHFVLDLSFGHRRTPAGRGGALLRVVPDLSVAAFAVFLLVEGIGYVQAGALRTATNSGVNMAAVYAAIPAFAALTVMFSVRRVLAGLRPRAPASGSGHPTAPGE